MKFFANKIFTYLTDSSYCYDVRNLINSYRWMQTDLLSCTALFQLRLFFLVLRNALSFFIPLNELCAVRLLISWMWVFFFKNFCYRFHIFSPDNVNCRKFCFVNEFMKKKNWTAHTGSRWSLVNFLKCVMFICMYFDGSIFKLDILLSPWKSFLLHTFLSSVGLHEKSIHVFCVVLQ